ncbi:MAG: hypothetical protein K8S25_12470 [Alphaproteobacteria bacterium]|nr:hypothetical protein [Alphaproteobacteria bacterium]
MLVWFDPGHWNAAVEFVDVIGGKRLSNFTATNFGDTIKTVCIELIVGPGDNPPLRDRTKFEPEHEMWDLSLVLDPNKLSGSNEEINCYIADRIVDGLLKSGKNRKIKNFSYKEFANELGDYMRKCMAKRVSLES